MRTLFSILFLLSFNLMLAQFSNEKIISNCTDCNPRAIYASDLDSDGDMDAVLVSRKDVSWYRNDGSGNFSEQILISEQILGGTAVYASDLDSDGDMDVLSASANDRKIAWYRNDGSGNFSEQILIHNQARNAQCIYAADLDGDGNMDVLSASDYDIFWYKNDGQGNFISKEVITTQIDFTRDVYAPDLDNDGDLDVLSASKSDGKIAWYRNDGLGNFSDQIIINSQEFITQNVVFPSDLDGDGNIDVIADAKNGVDVLWYKNDGLGNFSGKRHILTNSPQTHNTYAIHSTDMDGDGDNDILVSSNFSNKVTWYENNGQGNFSEQIISTKEGLTLSVYAADLDGDGDKDVLGADYNNNKLVWYENLLNYQSISGVTFWDENNNGLRDSFERPLKNIHVEITPDALATYTSQEGIFRFYVAKNTPYTITASPDSCWQFSTDSISYNIELIENISTGLDFGFQVVSDALHAQVRINSSPTRCGFEVPFELSIENDGCQPAKGQYGIVLSPLINLISSDKEPIEKHSDTLLWNYEELIATETQRLRLTFEIEGADFRGKYINLTGLSYIEDEFGNLNLSSTYDYSSEIRCAYDPNDKLVAPNRLADYDQNYTLFDETLEYTIRFQNTGNDTAFNVVIRDTLDKNLNWETFKPILTSHPFETLLYKDGQVEFSFKNILLPDSTTNEPKSHGFVTYKILPKKDLPENTVIENTAGIYFDFNSPIITNTTMNVLVSRLPKTTSINNLVIEQRVKVYPNPFGNFLTIEQEVFQFSNSSTLSLFDVTGRQIQSTILKDGTQQVSTTHLANGLYFYQVINADGEMIANGKVVKH